MPAAPVCPLSRSTSSARRGSPHGLLPCLTRLLMHASLHNREEIPWLKLIAYAVGIWLFVFGASGLRTDSASAITWVVVKNQAFHGVCILWGVLVLAATWFRYRGSFSTVAGVFLLGGALINSALLVVVQVKGLELDSPALFYVRTVLLWLAGCVLAVIGHLHHRRKSRPMI